MNPIPILELKGGMRPVKNEGGGGGVSFPKKFHFNVSAVDWLIERLTEVHQYWSVDRGIAIVIIQSLKSSSTNSLCLRMAILCQQL